MASRRPGEGRRRQQEADKQFGGGAGNRFLRL
jgi:hypothetical protein